MIKQFKGVFVSSAFTICSNILPMSLPLLIAVPAVTLFSQVAEAKTVPFILRKALGCNSMCEAIVVSQKTGNIYKVEYYDRIGANEGTEIVIEMDDYGDKWYKIINPVNGNSSSVYSVQRIN